MTQEDYRGMHEEKRHGAGESGGKSGGKGGKGGKSDFWLTVIGIGKLIKVTVLIAVGVGAILAVSDGPAHVLERVADWLGVAHSSRHLHRLLSHAASTSPKKLEEIGLGSFIYAALFATEGVGLLLKKRWGEYLTIVITISFLPLEVYEIVHHSSVAKVVTLVLNAIVAVYLIVRVRRERREEGGGGKAAPSHDRRRSSAPGRLGIASH